MATTQPNAPIDVGTTWSRCSVSSSGLMATEAPTVTDARRSNGSSGPRRSVSTDTLKPNDAGAANSNGDNPAPATTPKPTAAATTTRVADPTDLIVGRTAKNIQAATSAKSGYVICTTPATATSAVSIVRT